VPDCDSIAAVFHLALPMRVSRFRSLAAALLLGAQPGLAAASTLSVEAEVIVNPQTGGGELTALVRNTGDSAIELAAMPDWDVAGGLSVAITAPGGTVTTLPAAGDVPALAYTLDAATALGVSRTIAAGTFANAGTYVVVVTFADAQGPVASPPVEVVVGD
jgi:hypothetical protein